MENIASSRRYCYPVRGKVFMLMKHAKLKKKKSLHSDKFYVITTLYVCK